MGGAMAFNPDSRWLVVAEGILEKNVWLWDLNKMAANPTLLYGPSKDVTEWTFSPNGEWFALGDKDGTVRLWNLRDPLTPPRVFEGQKSMVFSLAISPDGRWLAKGIKGVAQVWDLSNPSASPLALPVEKYPVTTMAFSSNSRHLVAVGGFLQKMVWVWDLMNLAAPPMVLRGHDDGIKAVSFGLDRRWLVTGSKDGCARIFDLSAPDPSVEPLVLRQYKGFLKGQWGVTAVAFSPDGRWLCTSSIGTAHLWRLKSEDLIALACNLAGRNLSCEEWQQFLVDEPYSPVCPELPYPKECDEKRQTKSSQERKLQ
jgi:WD40 repeat protein